MYQYSNTIIWSMIYTSRQTSFFSFLLNGRMLIHDIRLHNWKCRFLIILLSFIMDQLYLETWNQGYQIQLGLHHTLTLTCKLTVLARLRTNFTTKEKISIFPSRTFHFYIQSMKVMPFIITLTQNKKSLTQKVCLK
jgi:hypothetical protein